MASTRTVDIAGCIHFSYTELREATNDFNSNPVGGCKIGEGGFGSVFKGKLKCTNVAIKVLIAAAIPKDERSQRLATEQFDTELRVLTKFRHPNLVILIGYHNSHEFKSLVYEFLQNGTLEDALGTGLRGDMQLRGYKAKSAHLPWMCRIAIATDTARGLAYLHTADKVPLVHRDVKSANILLDLSFRAKVGDFGLARSLQESDGNNRTVHVMGTTGYIPPEYYRGEITTKMDTFSFGVVILEVLSGLPPYDPKRSPKDLVTYMEQDMDKNEPQVLCTKIDKHAGDWPSDSFLELFHIARECVNSKMYTRPEMTEVYDKLEKLMTKSAQLYAEQQGYRKDTNTL